MLDGDTGDDESTVYRDCSTYDDFDKTNEGGLRIEFDIGPCLDHGRRSVVGIAATITLTCHCDCECVIHGRGGAHQSVRLSVRTRETHNIIMSKHNYAVLPTTSQRSRSNGPLFTFNIVMIRHNKPDTHWSGIWW